MAIQCWRQTSLKAINQLSIIFDQNRLDVGDGVEATWRKKSCWPKFLSLKPTRVEAFQKDVDFALSQASNYSEAIIFGKAAKILRRHMLDHDFKFDGRFHEGCVEDAIPPSPSSSFA